LTEGVLIQPVTNLLQRVCPRTFLTTYALWIQQGQSLAREQLCQQLVQAGYTAIEQVNIEGEFALLGSLLDLFPMGGVCPYLLDFFVQQIISIRLLDVETQRPQPTAVQIQ
jgi:transcription-repair coupling factor (superfamily II helicase)